jgi:crotonobetainyl-CoA:carnitine CoA-transferase CaiB-like acyl-CoA transferase
MVVSYEQPELGEIQQLGFPIKLSRTPAGIHRPAPALGEHTAEVLGDSGYSAEEIQALQESGAAKGLDAAPREETFLA